MITDNEVNQKFKAGDTLNLYKGDCLEIMKEIKDKSIDMILCDLPYGNGKTACKWDNIIPSDKLWEQYNRIIQDNGAIVLFGQEPFSTYLRLSNIKNYKYDWIWMKNQPTGIACANIRPMSNHELLSVFCKVKTTYNKQLVPSKISDRVLGRSNGKFTAKTSDSAGIAAPYKKDNPDNILLKMVNPRTILEFNVVPHSKGILHPTQKPVELLEYLIKTYTNECETVLDNCMGSGSTGVACKNTNRGFIGIELEEKYFNIATERLR